MQKITRFFVLLSVFWPFSSGLAEEETTPRLEPTILLIEARTAAGGEKNRNNILVQIAEVQTQIGEVDSALETIQLMEERYPSKRYAIERIVDSLVETKKLSQALQVVGALKEEYPKFTLMRKIAVAQAKFGDMKSSFERTSALPVHEADRAYHDISLLQAREGHVEEAFKTLKLIQNNDIREITTVYIGGAQAQNGDTSGALKTAEFLPEEVRAHGFWPIVCTLADQGDISRALQFVPNEEDSSTKVWARDLALRCIPQAQAQQGDVKGALKTVMEISGGAFRQEALLDIVRARSHQGDFSGAEEAIGLMKDDEKDSGGFVIADEYSLRKNFMKAIETASSISDRELRDATLEMIVTDQARGGNFTDALDLTDVIQDSCHKARGISAVAVALAESGQYIPARTTIDGIPKGECPKNSHPHKLTISKMPEGTRMITSPLYFPNPKLKAIRNVSAAQTKKGDSENALNWGNEFVFPLERASVLLGVADGLLAGDSPPP